MDKLITWLVAALLAFWPGEGRSQNVSCPQATLLERLAGKAYVSDVWSGYETLRASSEPRPGGGLALVMDIGGGNYKFVRHTVEFGADQIGTYTWDGEGKGRGRETKPARTISGCDAFMIEYVYFGVMSRVYGLLASDGKLLIVETSRRAKSDNPFQLMKITKLVDSKAAGPAHVSTKVRTNEALTVLGMPLERLPTLLSPAPTQGSTLAVLQAAPATQPQRPPEAVQTPAPIMGEGARTQLPSSVIQSSGPRIALVIANSSYGPNLGALPNPVNDGRVVSEALRIAGFEVIQVVNADQRSIKRAISTFGERLSVGGPGAVGLFFYAGHGLQSRGTNYLVPIDAPIEREADIDLEAVSADTVLRQMEEAGISTSIVILDSCRNMPLQRSFRGGVRGLARMDAPNGSFVAYSTAPGSEAADRDGDNSPFATALVAEMRKPGQPVEIMFRNIRRAVLTATEGRQTPWDSSSLLDSFVFVPEGS